MSDHVQYPTHAGLRLPHAAEQLPRPVTRASCSPYLGSLPFILLLQRRCLHLRSMQTPFDRGAEPHQLLELSGHASHALLIRLQIAQRLGHQLRVTRDLSLARLIRNLVSQPPISSIDPVQLISLAFNTPSQRI